MTERWINIDSEEILNPKGPSWWPAPKDARLEQGGEVKSYFNFNWRWGRLFYYCRWQRAILHAIIWGPGSREMGMDVIWVVGRWCVTIPVHRVCWETSFCQMEIPKSLTEQKCWCFVLIVCLFLAGSVLKCELYPGRKEIFFFFKWSIFKWFFATSEI